MNSFVFPNPKDQSGLTLEELDSYYVESMDHAMAFSSLLLNSDSYEAVHRKYGLGSLLWASILCPYSNDSNLERCNSYIGEQGFDLDLFERARQAVWVLGDEQYIENSETVMRTYAMLKLHHPNQRDLHTMMLKELMKEPLILGCFKDQSKASRYSLLPLFPENASEGPELDWGDTIVESGRKRLKFEIYLDAPLALALCYEKLPIALCGFFASCPDTITVNQIQGVRPFLVDEKGAYIKRGSNGRALFGVDFESLLVNAVAAFACSLGFSKLRILAARHNSWVQKSFTGFDLKTAERRYDQTASRLGFVTGSDGNWHRHLGTDIRVASSSMNKSMITELKDNGTSRA
ncbi:MAG: hypothetical protein GYA55_10075 [SAR324 cluster bacterium]|uniref:Uncharacterized protein n=1 Tax=SAR324 cluster bacterium TaxID=2024889 RepID=A0A7X9FTA7_9DELT|nr:hypothetical protein [SAR324 cluster bacterium]